MPTPTVLQASPVRHAPAAIREAGSKTATTPLACRTTPSRACVHPRPSARIAALLSACLCFATACDEKRKQDDPANAERQGEDEQARAQGQAAGEAAQEAADQAATDPADEGKDKSLDDFEGEMDLVLTAHSGSSGEPETQKLLLQVQGTTLRIDLPQMARGPGAGYQLIDMSAGKMHSVLDAQKMVLVLDFQEMQQKFGGILSAHEQADPPPKLRRTDDNAEIAGYSCRYWEVVTPKDGKQRMCVADVGAKWFQLPQGSLDDSTPWAKELMDGRHFPLRIESNEGPNAYSMQVERIEEKDVPDERFEIPENYRVVDPTRLLPGLAPGADGKMNPPLQKALEQTRQR